MYYDLVKLKYLDIYSLKGIITVGVSIMIGGLLEMLINISEIFLNAKT